MRQTAAITAKPAPAVNQKLLCQPKWTSNCPASSGDSAGASAMADTM